MYYVWEQYTERSGEYAYFSTEPSDSALIDWSSGEKITQNVPEIVITTDEGKSTRLTDLLLTSFDMQIFSLRLVETLQDIGIKNIDYYPITVINHETGDVDRSYNAAQIIGKIACLDLENSEYKLTASGKNFLWLEHFRLHEENIKPDQEIEGIPLLFRLAEFPLIILVEESVKNRLEKEGITGVKFIAPVEYAG